MDQARTPRTSPQRVGLLAGAGRFPIAFARSAQARGYSVHCVGIAGLFDPELPEVVDSFESVSVARVGRAIRSFKRAGVRHVVMAGKVEKRLWFQPARFFHYLPDWRTVHMCLKYLRQDKKDDTFSLAVIREFERDRIRFESALKYCPELLVKHGFLTRRRPSPSQWQDIKFGWTIAKELGRLDIGQTVVVSERAVLALEAIEGTDEAIRRAGQLCKRGGFTVVKVAKPQQDMRFDVPAVGITTIQTMHESGGRVLAIEAGLTILLDHDEVIRLADKLGIAIVALKHEEVQMRMAS
ncbi:MAG: LpxI family protein [Planctomycetes bacterium]|nr:LpxI family protein [Planctomycetota bacterium]